MEYDPNELLQALPLFVAVIDENGAMLYLNQHQEGFEPGSSLGRSIDDYIAKEDQARVRATIDGVVESGKPAFWTVRALVAPGRYGHYRTDVSLLGCDPVRLLLVSRDETELEIDRELHEASLHLEDLAGAGSWYWNPRTDRIKWSRQMYEIMEVDPHTQPSTELFFARIHPDDRSRVEAQSEEISRTGRAPAATLRLLIDGREKFIRVTSRAVYDTEGRLEGMVGAVVDVTAVRGDEQRRRQTERLAAMGRLAGNIAHDFNNSMMAINMFVEEIAITSPDVADQAQQMRRIVESTAGLTRQLLSFARGEPGTPVHTSLTGVIHGSLPILERLISGRGRLRLELPSEPLGALVDPSHIAQVLMNLVLNAADATAPGSEEDLSIELREEQLSVEARLDTGILPAGRYAVLSVIDRGAGIAPDIIDRIFDPFFTTKADHGTGLGLSSVLGIVQQYDGQMAVQSEPGRGSVFRVYIPLTEAPAGVVSLKPPRVASRAARILLVDDDDFVRQSTSRVLHAHGYEVSVAASGEAALELAAATDFDLVISDLRMPGMSGDRLVEILGGERGMACLLLSGHPSVHSLPPHEHRARVLTKPISAQQLLAVIVELLPGSRA